MPANTITSANAVVTITIPGVYSSPQSLQGFATDAAFDTDTVDVAETRMGVDGVMSSGFTPFITVWNIHFQADSLSNIIFETWLAAQKAGLTTFPASGTTNIPSVGRKYAMTNGILKRVMQMPNAKKTLDPRVWTVDWQDISPSNAGIGNITPLAIQALV